MKGSPVISDLLENDYPNELQKVVLIMRGVREGMQLRKFCERYNCRQFNFSAGDAKRIERLDKKVDEINALLLAEKLDENKIIGISIEIAEICGMDKKRTKDIGSILQSFKSQKIS